MNLRTTSSALFLASLLTVTGCASIDGMIGSTSDSLGGSSESVTNSSTSISDSSGSGGDVRVLEDYRSDVRAYTLAWMLEEDALLDDSLLEGVSAIAEAHGITHWEKDTETLRTIGDVVQSGELSERRRAALSVELQPFGDDVALAILGTVSAS